MTPRLNQPAISSLGNRGNRDDFHDTAFLLVCIGCVGVQHRRAAPIFLRYVSAIFTITLLALGDRDDLPIGIIPPSASHHHWPLLTTHTQRLS
jgi:hypothetical protein